MFDETKLRHAWKISVSGAADTSYCGAKAFDQARALGRAIAKHNAVILTGATTGFPLWSAMGVKEANGFSIGISPASSRREHEEAYRLPLDYMDFIMYTGFGYAGRDLILTRSSDAVIFGCGRIGTIHEFTVAFEDDKPIGVLQGPWEMDETLKLIIERGHRQSKKIVFDTDPDRLVAKVIDLIKNDRRENLMTYSSRPTQPDA